MSFDLKAKSLFVFSHPNHEIAVLALISRMRPKLVFLTDGGGQHRVNETRNSLRELGLESKAIFLPNTEKEFYDGLLHLDTLYFAKVAANLRAILNEQKPEQILCDAVEFYNPVHDMALPLLVAAEDAGLGGIFEIPLLYQKPGPTETYGVQTVPEYERDRIEIELSEEESALKERALNNTYTILRDTLGLLLLSSPEALKKETLVPAKTPLRTPDPGRVLRYEHRAAALMKKGAISSEITHAFHYLPVVSDITNHSRR